MPTVDLAKQIAELLYGAEDHTRIAAIEIAARILFENHHVKLVLEPV